MEINIKDYFKVDDSHSKIRGFIFAYEDGKLVFHKENMITEAGRRLIFNSIRGSDTMFSIDSLIPRVGSGTIMTQPSMEGLVSPISYENVVITPRRNKFDNDSLYVMYSFNVKLSELASNVIKISELGLFYKEDGKQDTMFSRVVFQPYTLTHETTLEFKYYIYF